MAENTITKLIDLINVSTTNATDFHKVYIG